MCCVVDVLPGPLLMYLAKEMRGEVENDIVDRFIRFIFIVIHFVLFTLLFQVFFLKEQFISNVGMCREMG